MKSFALLTITAALASVASASKDMVFPDLARPGVEVETRPPVIIVETITLTKSWVPKETGRPHWRPHMHHTDVDKDEEEGPEETEEEEEEDEGKEEGGKDKEEGDAGSKKKEWNGIHANSFAPKASINAAQVSSVARSVTSAAASKATSYAASRASTAVAGATSAVSPTSSGSNIRVGGALVAGAAGIAAYLLL